MPSSGCKKCARSEEHTSELQSHDNLVCRLLLEKEKRTPGLDQRSVHSIILTAAPLLRASLGGIAGKRPRGPPRLNEDLLTSPASGWLIEPFPLSIIFHR